MQLSPSTKNETGRRFGRLVVLRPARDKKYNCLKWVCICDCGTQITARGLDLRRGKTQSCGCYHRDRTAESHRKHGFGASGKRRAPEYNVWALMKRRCSERSDVYEHYTGRGIKVCDRWLDSFEAFYADMGPRPSPKHEIDRRDNDGDYTPDNCRWVEKIVNRNNKRSNIRITINGVTLTASQWAHRVGIKPSSVLSRIARGWAPDRAVLTATRPGSRGANNAPVSA